MLVINSAETTIGVRLTNGEILRRTCNSTTTLRDVQLFIDQVFLLFTYLREKGGAAIMRRG